MSKSQRDAIRPLMPIIHMAVKMPFDELNELLWKYHLSDIVQKEHEEIEKEIDEEDIKFQNKAMASNFANFKPISPSKRKNTD